MARTFIRTTDLEDAIITSAKLASSAVVTAALADLNVTTGKIADSAITEGKLGSGAVTAAKIGSGAVETAKLADSAVTAAKLASDSVETAKIAALAVTAAKLASDSVETAKIAALAVTAAKLADGSVETAKLAALAVTAAKLADGSVETAKIAGAAVTEAKLGDGAVATAKLADNAVTAAKLADGAVDTAAILDGNVTTAKLANNAVTAGKADLSGSDWSFGQGRLKTTMSATPADSEVVTKAYLDSYAQGVNWKESVRAANIYSGAMDPAAVKDGDTFGGVTVATGDRILAFGTTPQAAAGVYVVGASASTRAPDFDSPNEIKGAAVFVREGTNLDAGFICTTDGTIVVGTTPLSFTQFTGLGQIVAGNGLSKTGNTLDVNVGNGVQIVSDSVTLKLASGSNALTLDANGLMAKLKTNGGVGVDANGIFVNTANGVQVDGSGYVSIKLNASNPGLQADGSGLSAKLDSADGSLDVGASGLKVKDLGIVSGKIAAGAVVEAKLADSAVATAKIADSAVTTAKINALAVTEGKLADSAVATAKIADGAVTYAKLASDVKSAIGKFDNGVTFTATSGQTTFTLSHADADSSFGGHQVFLNGRLQFIGAGNDYTFSDGTGPGGFDQIVFTFSLAAGDFVAVCYGRAA